MLQDEYHDSLCFFLLQSIIKIVVFILIEEKNVYFIFVVTLSLFKSMEARIKKLAILSLVNGSAKSLAHFITKGISKNRSQSTQSDLGVSPDTCHKRWFKREDHFGVVETWQKQCLKKSSSSVFFNFNFASTFSIEIELVKYVYAFFINKWELYSLPPWFGQPILNNLKTVSVLLRNSTN